MKIGIIGAVLGLVFAVMGIVNTGAPTPLAIVIFVVGLLAAAAGFAKRVLAAVERR